MNNMNITLSNIQPLTPADHLLKGLITTTRCPACKKDYSREIPDCPHCEHIYQDAQEAQE